MVASAGELAVREALAARAEVIVATVPTRELARYLEDALRGAGYSWLPQERDAPDQARTVSYVRLDRRGLRVRWRPGEGPEQELLVAPETTEEEDEAVWRALMALRPLSYSFGPGYVPVGRGVTWREAVEALARPLRPISSTRGSEE